MPAPMVEAGRERRRRETAALWEQITASTSEEEGQRLRDEVVTLNMSVALSIARRYASRGVATEDLEQVACLGLVKAARGFDPSRQKDFWSYAVPTVSGEVKKYFRDFGWVVRPPRRVQDLQARVNAAFSDSAARSGTDPRPPEIAAHLGVELSAVVESMMCRGAFAPTSLDAPVGGPEASDPLGSLLASAGDDYRDLENSLVLGRALGTLSARDRLILRRRFFEDRTQQEIGDEIGVSQMQVSRLLARILAALRALVDPPESELQQPA